VTIYEAMLDDLEAGELSVEFEGQEPQALLEWALERFAPRIAISTAFQIDGSVLIDMAYAIDPNVKVFTVDTGRLPEETFELVEQVRERYPGIELEILTP
jgi:phosphoadenosine phosphosulfate reductase